MTEPSAVPRRSLLRKILRPLLWGLAVLIALVLIRAYFAFRDRLPGYAVAINIESAKSLAEPRPLSAAFASTKINAALGPGKRPVWIAGFSQHRAATAIHDDLWASACVLDDGWSRVAIVALDAIGFFQDDVAQVRSRLAADWKISYTIVCSTHNHSTPDLMGLWGPSPLRTGVDPVYREQVIQACVASISNAVSNLQPALVAFHEIPTDPAGLVADTRKPEVFDPDLRIMHLVRAADHQTLGSVVTWGDHPETLWGKNTEITSDFCGYLRDALEKGVEIDGRKYTNGVGGIHVYLNGAVGGLMSTTPRVTVRDPFLQKDFTGPSHEKARALGHQLAIRVLPRLQDTNTSFSDHLPISIRARTVNLPLANNVYLLAGFLGLIDRGYVSWRTLRTEVALLTLGPASIACIPGEIYPEIVNGGVEKPAGGDFDIPIVEQPPLRELMPGRPKFVFGLANDEIGYIIPKTQWDAKAPYTYGSTHGHYGEVNSVGPEAAPVIYGAIKTLCQEAK